MTASRFRNFIERIERLEEERKTIADDIANVYAELKGEGFDKDAAKTVLKIRKSEDGLSKWTERSAIVDTYLVALGMVPDDAPRARARTRENVEEFPSHDAETGELAEQAEPVDAAVTTGNDLRKPDAADQGQIVRGGDAPREASNGEDRKIAHPDTDSEMPSGADTGSVVGTGAPIQEQRETSLSQHEGGKAVHGEAAQATVRNSGVTAGRDPHSNSQTPATSSSQALTGAVAVPHAAPSAERAAPVVSSGPVHFADREHLTVPDDVDLTIPAFLKRSA